MPITVPHRALLVGFGAANRAVAGALLARGHEVVIVDDRPNDDARTAARALGAELLEAPDTTTLSSLIAGLVGGAGVVVPSPGVPDGHPSFTLAADHGVDVVTEFDLAGAWDARPIIGITGTNGKTTVTTMVTEMLRAGGTHCIDAGNNDIPLVAAIDDPAPEWFVVEASSFRLGRTHGWAPRVATWLNLAPDHLDVHSSHADYEAAKAKIWESQTADDVAIGNLDDPVVAARLAVAPARHVGFSLLHDDVDYGIDSGRLVGLGSELIAIGDLPRALPHDLANALAASATAEAAGCAREAVQQVLRHFSPLPHRVCPVGAIDGIVYYDDSKATVPHATLAAVRSFPSVVLIAGGRNKGLDLRVLAEAEDHIRAVVAIGDSSAEVAAAFDGRRRVEIATSMAEAVAQARALARSGDAVLLSPACASYDWYPNYAARGDDFASVVTAIEGAS